jgi:hypothetical protein
MCFTLAHLYSLYMHGSSTLAKVYGTIVWWYWEHFEEHIENIEKPKTVITPILTQKRKIEPFQVHVEPSHWLHEKYDPKTIYPHFGLG